jgi:phage-related baseplate assembly protein
VLFRNINTSEGGYDKETLEEAKRRAPKDYALQRSIVTPEDYAQAVTNFSHPTFGIIKKSIVTLRSSINANLVEIYVLSEGQDGLPVAANEGLKRALSTYIDQLNVATDSIQVLDGKIKPVDVEINVVIYKNADASIVRQKVENVITSYFSLNSWDMGEAFYTSQFIDQLQSIDGISFVDLFSPNDNILPTGQLGDGDPLKIGFNEIITLGSRKTSYYYERTPPPAGYGR